MSPAINRKLMEAVLKYGDRYCAEILWNNASEGARYTREQLLGDWRKALRFFFDRAFFQGRLDIVSAKVLKAANEVLDPELYFAEDIALMDEAYLHHLSILLSEKVGKGKVGKGRDVEMVVSTLRCIRDLPNWNIVAHTVERVRSGKVRDHFVDLQKVTQVGPKIAAFYPRDVVSTFDLESGIPKDQQKYLQPVDVWVRKIAFKIGLVPEKSGDAAISEAIVELSADGACSAVKFNQGTWYMGYNAFDLLLQLLLEDK